MAAGSFGLHLLLVLLGLLLQPAQLLRRALGCGVGNTSAADWGKVNKALLDRNNASASVVTLVHEGARTRPYGRCDFAHFLLSCARF